jgi:uncharacterized protein with FMN-binding domain
MSMNQQPRVSRFKRTVRKLSLSAFVVFTFVAYAIHERLAGPQGGPALAPSAPRQAQASPPTAPKASANGDTPARAPAQPTTPPAKAPPTEAPPTIPAPTPAAPQMLGQYKDGDYVGAEVDAYYGLVQVQATIKQGKLADIQFVEYPNDRRTSIRINNVAMPYLEQEAIQAQSANVDIISGATLTSEAFVQSLRAALDSAKVGV